MADRIITKGLKTGTGVGGVKYILRRGLLSSIAAPAPTSLETLITFNVFIEQSRDYTTYIEQKKDFDVEL